jgi:antitoxin (DNA-binding transcriptional repressor) of toxin-antitoxin stability system
MKTIQMPKELRPLLEFAEASAAETLVFTEKKRPVAALVSLRKVDRESLALSTNPEFWRIIETARKEIRAGKSTTLETLERKLAAPAPNKRSRQTRARG